ncbi:uncharacterized protein Z518_01510 [Rhinocladiella mackenziei CBS 650.93]|uniref:Rab proteins geranylgeranyltransferase n=1 Tax=Rhinocladiella mackenziei CBS 650.93 TaxID=1442369 RepID=A0A0D2HIC8_9EURO|nr:uncharacterized protein Z518_01510 [Rhinocladiella mackenziei CBS 650.93]KIX10428.1 hypothetical protein Z518_01510 [Rhinocladiella mackenziei CBS 650.93]
METLSNEIWDVVIAGTSIPQSLLALSLSRSGKKVLHVDRHPYYGGNDTGLSLQEAEEWVQDVNKFPSAVFKDASISRPPLKESNEQAGNLQPSRTYTLSLKPQIVYAKSEFLPTIVSSRIHTQLEFLAVGSWWVHRDGALHKIPSTREDVFNDESLSMKDKRGLMKFLRYVMQEGDESTTDVEEEHQMSLRAALTSKFKIPGSLQPPLLALALSPVAADAIHFDTALARIRRHMRSMGYFGPGFPAVIAKYGGNSEISQVACRAGAVGGGVYLLGHELTRLESPETSGTRPNGDGVSLIRGTLSDGTRIQSRYVVGSLDDIPTLREIMPEMDLSNPTWRSISIVADPLRALFPQTSDNGPVPAVAIVLIDAGAEDTDKSPVYLQIHSEDTGECPTGQCVIYASVVADDASSKSRLEAAVNDFLDTCGTTPSLLWSLSYQVSGPAIDPASPSSFLRKNSSQVLVFAPEPHDQSFHDGVLGAVKEAWKVVMGADAADSTFLRFEDRESEVED